MKIIKTNEYFIDPLNKRIENIESKGSQYDKMGKGFEDLLANLINKEEKNDFELELIKSLNLIFGKEVKECKVIRDNKCKGDILITFIDDSTTCISLKNTNASQVSGGEYCVNTVCDYFENDEFSKHFKNFNKVEYRATHLKEQYKESFNYLQDFWGNTNNEKLLRMITEGVSEENKPTYILFLDKNNGNMFISSIDDYIDFVIKYGANGTFGSHSAITASSRGQFQVKLKNPLRMKNRDNLIQEFLDSKEA